MTDEKFENDESFDGRCKQVIDFMRIRHEDHDEQTITFSTISRKFRWRPSEHAEIRDSLLDQALIAVHTVPVEGEQTFVYKLL